MFTKIVIANRGEIAIRVIRTCRRLGIKTVAVYSEADRTAAHVFLADEAYLLGAAPVSESYLNGEKLISIAKAAKAEAIHPGYGFLSEQASFASRCQEEGIVFIGPSPEIIALMGDKIAARKAMEAAGFPVIPGTMEAVKNEEEAVDAAAEIGFPVMLKAAAGGGGIGMELVRNPIQLKQAFDATRQRASRFFKNGEMFLEKALEGTRHIEIQLLADHDGHVIHLFERDCSIQRRHQKVIEEAPAASISGPLGEKIAELAVTAAKQLGYTNAGTIECLVDQKQNVYFLEMNTRLQVEHPVTEEVTGLDLVEWQLRIAAGEKLELRQEEIACTGHALEARIYAEDPETFLPSPGKITGLLQPQEPYIRHECAVSKGSVVSPFYDPMIAKIIVNGSSRLEAIERMKYALRRYQIEGIKTNLPLLRKVINHHEFSKGNVTTKFIMEHIDNGES
ncbi:acetyl-CoA carboxylase biotin carboxylase subunit [Halalkalibacter oceani]|uniref:acetyl-CoA carboxylase biotin carboxylase subunit n=1 Tax=Halalkalibacter oceani TaxID=1653776 RepID=UPI003396AC57